MIANKSSQILAAAVVTAVGFGGFGTANAHQPQGNAYGHSYEHGKHKGHKHKSHGHHKGHGKHKHHEHGEQEAPAPEAPAPGAPEQPAPEPTEPSNEDAVVDAPAPAPEAPVAEEPAPPAAPPADTEVVPVSSEVEPIEAAPAPAPAPAPAVTPGTGGVAQGGEIQTFTNAAGTTSQYRVYTPTPRAEAPGMIFYGDGSGAYGWQNPNQSYLVGGSNGLAAVAEAQNMILVLPLAPGGLSNSWYTGDIAGKAQWASDLMTHIKSQYPVNQDRIVVGGYSSGAQMTTYLSKHWEAQSVDLAVPIAYGSAPYGDLRTSFSPAYAASTDIVFNTGTADPGAYGAAQSGAAYFASQGFNVDPTYPAGVTHDRGGEFGGIVNDAITKYTP